MIELPVLFSFVLVVLALFLIPGPAVLMTLARAASGGRRIGVLTGLGIACGDLMHALLATFGLSAVLMTSATAFAVVKYAGVAYLVYLGLKAIFEKTGELSLPSARKVDGWMAFRQGALTEMLNPKTALFFLAFLPQFVHQGQGSVTLQLAELGLLFALLSAIYSSFVAMAGSALGGWIGRNRGIGRWQGKVVGTIYLGLGAKLALQER
ncbi:LysE family translocator [Luteimonas panaciterrae]|uniref:LysE family translocator n=1 Tax=Luteimonas panaciterrae TaxID=363885 RepID=UPI001CF9F5DF|nr:LysE family translocator [Luteimonas panaciterrae]